MTAQKTSASLGSRMFGHLRTWLLTGLFVLAPSAVTLWVLFRLLNWVDNLLGRYLRFAALDYHRIPGLGLAATGLLLLVVGFIAARVGQGPVARLWDRLLLRIPGVGIVYGSTKSLGEAFLNQKEETFRKVVLVQWPQPGSWTIAFLTGAPGGDVANHLDINYVSVYVPTTPNPTGGYFVMLPRSAVVELDMSVDEALKYIISMGVVAPGSRGRRAGSAPVRVEPARQQAVNQ